MRRPDLASATLALCAVVLTVIAVRREFFVRSVDEVPELQEVQPSLTEATGLDTIGIRIGADSAKVTIIEFADLECPACRRFALSVRSVMQRYQPNVRLVFIHFPPSYHRFAYPAARAAECAEREGQFFAFSNAIFEKQDSLGLKTWISFARESGVEDLRAFESCTAESDSVRRISLGLEAGRRLGIRGTPTVIINGWRYPEPPDEDQLGRIVKGLIDRAGEIHPTGSLERGRP